VYSLGPLFLFLLTSLVVALVVAWVNLILSLIRQRKLSSLPAHLKTVFVRPCGAPTEEKPKVIISGKMYLRQKSRKMLHGKGGGREGYQSNHLDFAYNFLCFLCYFKGRLLKNVVSKKGALF
jgi:hypothetical protein